MGNKIDLTDQRVVTTEEGDQLAKKLGYAFVETSAKTNTDVEKAFHTTVRQMNIIVSYGPPPQPRTKKSRCTIC